MKPTPVLVVWEDIHVMDSTTWVETDAEMPAPCEVRHVGWLIGLDAAHAVMTDALMSGYTGPRCRIPTATIRTIHELTTGRAIPLPRPKRARKKPAATTSHETPDGTNDAETTASDKRH